MPDAQDIALKRFDSMSRYLSFETTMYWTRSQFFLVANAGLLAFMATKLFDPDLIHPYLAAMVCLFGAALSLNWYLALRTGQYWTHRWEMVCVALEPDAMGDIEVFRNCRAPGHISTKRIARITAVLFLLVWSAIGAWTVISYNQSPPKSQAGVPTTIVQPKPPQSN